MDFRISFRHWSYNISKALDDMILVSIFSIPYVFYPGTTPFGFSYYGEGITGGCARSEVPKRVSEC